MLLAIVSLLLGGIGGCWRLDPALLEGSWQVERIVITSRHAGSDIFTRLFRGAAIEFRNGRALIPLVGSDTLRLEYRLYRDTLELRSGILALARCRIVYLGHDQLRLQNAWTATVLSRR